jgi:hypothetical protein
MIYFSIWYDAPHLRHFILPSFGHVPPRRRSIFFSFYTSWFTLLIDRCARLQKPHLAAYHSTLMHWLLNGGQNVCCMGTLFLYCFQIFAMSLSRRIDDWSPMPTLEYVHVMLSALLNITCACNVSAFFLSRQHFSTNFEALPFSLFAFRNVGFAEYWLYDFFDIFLSAHITLAAKCTGGIISALPPLLVSSYRRLLPAYIGHNYAHTCWRMPRF